MINFLDPNLYLIFLFGLMIGSFLNVLIYRLPREIPFSTGRSKCINCEHTLQWYDLFPLFSYIFLRGKCRYCKCKISIQYPLVELTTAILFSTTYSLLMNYKSNFGIIGFIALIICSLVVLGIYTDFLYHGTFDYSTSYVCILFFIMLIIANKSIIESLKSLLLGLTYLLPILSMALYVYFKNKGKIILSILTLTAFIMLAMFSLLRFNVDIMVTSIFFINVVNWLPLCLVVILSDYIINKLIKSEKVTNKVTYIADWIKFVSFFMFAFNKSSEMLSIKSMLSALSINGKNICVVILFTMMYVFFVEIFNGYDNDESIIDEDEELIDREENLVSSYIGDGDLLVLPFAGMMLGGINIFNFYTIMCLTVMLIYIFIFKKGFKYSIPLYPYIIFSIIVTVFTYTV